LFWRPTRAEPAKKAKKESVSRQITGHAKEKWELGILALFTVVNGQSRTQATWAYLVEHSGHRLGESNIELTVLVRANGLLDAGGELPTGEKWNTCLS
jgi:hypothetical protein